MRDRLTAEPLALRDRLTAEPLALRDRLTAGQIVAGVGTDMTRFGSSARLPGRRVPRQRRVRRRLPRHPRGGGGCIGDARIFTTVPVVRGRVSHTRP